MNTIEIGMRLTTGAAVLYPGPYLNQLRGESIERRCHDLLGGGVRYIIINFVETELINSIGVSNGVRDLDRELRIVRAEVHPDEVT